MNRYAFRPPRRASGADANTDDLLKYATDLGLSVSIIEDKDGCPEFLIGGWNVMRLAEGKAPKGKLRKRQKKWRERWRGPPPGMWRTTADVDRTAAEMREESERKRGEAFEARALSEEDLSDDSTEGCCDHGRTTTEACEVCERGVYWGDR